MKQVTWLEPSKSGYKVKARGLKKGLVVTDKDSNLISLLDELKSMMRLRQTQAHKIRYWWWKPTRYL